MEKIDSDGESPVIIALRETIALMREEGIADLVSSYEVTWKEVCGVIMPSVKIEYFYEK